MIQKRSDRSIDSPFALLGFSYQSLSADTVRILRAVRVTDGAENTTESKGLDANVTRHR